MRTAAALCRFLHCVVRSQFRGSHSGDALPVPSKSWRIASVSCDAQHKQASERGMHWIFLGCPGVGKGTYASRLSKLLNIPHIAMGDLVREELVQVTPFAEKLTNMANQGKLLPDDVILDLLVRRLQKEVRYGETGFILDGFPRNCSQAEILEQVTDVDVVVNLRLREDVLIMKCLGRRICSGCGSNYNLTNIDVEGIDGGPRICMPPLLPPPACASKLKVRPDDTEEVVRARLQIHADESKPVEEYYRKQGKLLDFDVAGDIAQTWSRLLAALKLKQPDEAEELLV